MASLYTHIIIYQICIVLL